MTLDSHSARSASTPPASTIPPTAAGRPARTTDSRSIADLLGELRDEGIALLRKEGQLARAEMSQKVDRVGNQLGQIAAGGALLFAGAVVLLGGLAMAFTALLDAIGINEDVAIWLGPIVFGLVITLLGAVLFKKAVDHLKQVDPVPERTAETLSENAHWAQQKATATK